VYIYIHIGVRVYLCVYLYIHRCACLSVCISMYLCQVKEALYTGYRDINTCLERHVRISMYLYQVYLCQVMYAQIDMHTSMYLCHVIYACIYVKCLCMYVK